MVQSGTTTPGTRDRCPSRSSPFRRRSSSSSNNNNAAATAATTTLAAAATTLGQRYPLILFLSELEPFHVVHTRHVARRVFVARMLLRDYCACSRRRSAGTAHYQPRRGDGTALLRMPVRAGRAVRRRHGEWVDDGGAGAAYDIETHGAAMLAAVQALQPAGCVWGDARLPR
jgi:hypothetical protein